MLESNLSGRRGFVKLRAGRRRCATAQPRGQL